MTTALKGWNDITLILASYIYQMLYFTRTGTLSTCFNID